jgi:hypothetical protein
LPPPEEREVLAVARSSSDLDSLAKHCHISIFEGKLHYPEISGLLDKATVRMWSMQSDFEAAVEWALDFEMPLANI